MAFEARPGGQVQQPEEEPTMIALAAHRRQAFPPHEEPYAGAVMSAVAGHSAALALDYLEQGVFILDADSQIQFASAAARRLIETNRLCIRNGFLCSPIASETMTLRRLVKERIAAASAGRAAMIFHRLDDAADGALCLGVTAARQPGRLTTGRPFAIIFVTKPSQISVPDGRQLRDHFGLTDAQARLAIEIAKGHGLKACARRLGIAETTARSHIRQIFEKTGTKRQAELVRLIYACQFSVRAP